MCQLQHEGEIRDEWTPVNTFERKAMSVITQPGVDSPQEKLHGTHYQLWALRRAEKQPGWKSREMTWKASPTHPSAEPVLKPKPRTAGSPGKRSRDESLAVFRSLRIHTSIGHCKQPEIRAQEVTFLRSPAIAQLCCCVWEAPRFHDSLGGLTKLHAHWCSPQSFFTVKGHRAQWASSPKKKFSETMLELQSVLSQESRRCWTTPATSWQAGPSRVKCGQQGSLEP